MNKQEIPLLLIEGNISKVKASIQEDIRLYSNTFDENGIWYEREILLLDTIVNIHKEEVFLKTNFSKTNTPFSKLVWLVEIENLIEFYKKSKNKYSENFQFLEKYLTRLFGKDFDTENLRKSGYEDHKHISSYIRIVIENLMKLYQEETIKILKTKKINNF